MSTSQDDVIKSLQKEQQQLEAERAKLETEKQLVEAEKTKLEAERLLAEARETLAAAKDPQLTELKRKKSLADAQKEVAESRLAAQKARLIGGEVTEGPHKGEVETKDNAGKTEGALLAASAARKAAKKIADRLSAADQAPNKLCVFEAADFSRFQQLLAFRFRKELLLQAFKVAGVRPPPKEEGLEATPAPAMASAGLDAFSKLLGYFKTDYVIGGIEEKLEPSILLYALSGALAKKKMNVYLPSIFSPGATSDAIGKVAAKLAQLANLRDAATGKIQALETQIADAEANAPPETIEGEKSKVAQLQSAIDLYDSFTSDLTKPSDDSEPAPLEALALDLSIEQSLKEGCAVLLVRLEHSGGGYLIKKNLLTGLGFMPLYYMGGATVSYLLLDGMKGKVIDGGILPLHGGFVKATRLRAALDKES